MLDLTILITGVKLLCIETVYKYDPLKLNDHELKHEFSNMLLKGLGETSLPFFIENTMIRHKIRYRNEDVVYGG